MDIPLWRDSRKLAIPGEEIEAERLLQEARNEVRQDIVKRLRDLNKAVAKGRYQEALTQSRRLTGSLVELALYYQ